MAAQSVRHRIGGSYVYSTLRKSYGVTDPTTGAEYAQVEVGLGADVNQAVLAALKALETGPWPALSASDRAKALAAMADVIDARAGDIAAAEALGPGLPVTQAREQASAAAAVFRLAAEALTTRGAADNQPGGGQPGGSQPGGSQPGGSQPGGSQPGGVAGLITSWRTPFLAQASAVAPALAAGCAVVLKPDEWAPLPAALLAEISAGLPDGVLNVVHGSLHRKAAGAQARDALVAHPRVARIWFDGDAATGRQIAVDAAASGKPARTELAGTGPCLIFEDADLDQALDAVLFGAFALNGQRRTATSVVLVERPVYELIVGRLAQRAERIRVGDPADPATELGPLPDAGLADAFTAGVRLGLREGARLVTAGRRPAGRAAGNFVAPTVLADVEPSMRIFTEPLRGPVLRIAPFDTEGDAAELALAVPDRTAAYLWTTDRERAQRLAPPLATPAVWVNAHNPHDQPGRVEADIDFFTRPLTVHASPGDTPAPRFGA